MKTFNHNTTATHEHKETRRRNEMKALTYAAIVLAMAAGAANADIVTDPALGALRMTLTYYPDGSATLMKNTIYDSGPLDVDAYEIWSASSSLDSGDLFVPPYTHGWKSLDDWKWLDLSTLMTELGVLARNFIELSAQTHFLAEGAFSATGAAYGTFQPSAPFSIGAPIQNAVPPESDLTFYYTKPGHEGDKFLGIVEFVPEPATLGLLALGGAVALVRRRRRAAGIQR